MDRSEEFARIVDVFASSSRVAPVQGINRGAEKEFCSAYMLISRRVCSYLDNNDVLVGKMRVFADRKEFSNDPTAALADVSQQFQECVSRTQAELARMKNMADGSDAKGIQQQQHRRLLFQGLNKRLSGHMEAFQSAVKEHTLNVNSRNRRVDRYGSANVVSVGSTSSLNGCLPSLATSANHDTASQYKIDSAIIGKPNIVGEYAMFQTPVRAGLAGGHNSPSPAKLPYNNSNKTMSHQMEPCNKNQSVVPMDTNESTAELRQRASINRNGETSNQALYTQRGGGTLDRQSSEQFESFESSSGLAHQNDDPQAKGRKSQQPHQFQNQGLHQNQNQIGRASVRLRGAEKIESAIAQMGSLFTQMAGLVTEQGDALTRIEDDVESGLEQIEMAHTEMQYFYEITKGNRSMIIKIFLLLLFFAFLFLKWI